MPAERKRDLDTQYTDIEERLRKMVAAKLKVPPEEIPLDTFLLDDAMDSMDRASLILEIEEEFAPVSLSAMEASEVRTIADLAALIGSRKA